MSTAVLAISFTLIVLFLYIYTSVKSKDLNIKILDQEQAKKVLEQEIIRLEECIRIKNKAMKDSCNTHHRLIKEKDQETVEVKKRCIELESTMDSTVKDAVEKARKDSIKRQRSILKGQATEHLAPYINSQYNPKDYKFMGDPIDYIIFDGMSEIKTKDDEIKSIILMDIKTGNSGLNRVQRAIKRAVKDKKVEFTIYRPEKDIEVKEDENVQPDERDNDENN